MILIVSVTPFSFIATGFAIIALILGLIAFVAVRRDKKRAQTLRLFAERNELAFKDRFESPSKIGLPDAVTFRQGHKQKFTNLMTGEIDGSYACVLDHRYSIGSGNSESAVQQTVVAIDTAEKYLPDFVLALEGYMQNAGETIHLHDPQSADFPEFSERYRLYGNDESATRELFTPHVIESCVGSRIYCIESCQGWLIVIEEDLRPIGDKLQRRIESAFGYLTELSGG